MVENNTLVSSYSDNDYVKYIAQVLLLFIAIQN